MLLAVYALVSCKKDEITEETITYEIKVPTSEFYTVSAPDKAEAGKIIDVTVNSVENVFVTGVLFNDNEAVEKSENTFRFEMPAENVDLKILTSSTVTVEPSSYFTGSADKQIAEPGETVTVTFTTLYATDMINMALVNGTIECTPISADLGEYVFSFKMPEGPAHVIGYTANEYFVIERDYDDHCQVIMLDCINHQGTPEEFCSQVTDGLVHFLYKWDIGYEVDCKVLGKTTGTDYSSDIFWSLATDNNLYQDCWAFRMPDEPVVIKASSKELGIYAGYDFTGEYKAYWMTLAENRIFTSDAPTMNLDLRESSAYIVTSTDENAYDFSGLYTVTDGKITYDPENVRGNHALSGKVIEDGFAFIIVDDIINNKADNRRYYLAGKEDFRFTCATDTEYATRFLLETEANGQKNHYFVEISTNSLSVVTADFQNGSSISESSVAIISKDGKPYLRYSYQNGSAPEFQYCGNEAGTYSSMSGSSLVLDGFNTATYNGVPGTYTIKANIVTFTDGSGSETSFNIDTNTNTFTEIKPVSELKLDSAYSTDIAWIGVETYVTQTGYVRIVFDSDYSGNNFKEGYASIRIWFYDMGREKEMIGSCEPYFIDEDARTVTISNVYQGTGTSWSTTEKDVVLKISEDCKTLTFVDPYIYSTSSPNTYCYGGQYTQLVSETPGSTEPEAGWNGPKTYSASGLIAYQDLSPYEFGGAIFVYMDKDMDGNVKTDYATVKVTVNDTPIVHDCKPYVYDESTSTLTIQGISQGWMSGKTDMDMPFKVSGDKSQIQLPSDYNYGNIYAAEGIFAFTYVTVADKALIGE